MGSMAVRRPFNALSSGFDGEHYQPLAVVRVDTGDVFTPRQLLEACTATVANVPIARISPSDAVAGPLRPLFSAQPLTSVTQQYSMEPEVEEVDSEPELATFSSIGTQTALRESATQTSQRDIDCPPTQEAIVLELWELRNQTLHKNPAAELRAVRRLAASHHRAKRAFEATLPIPTDNSSRTKRLQMLGEWEEETWKRREQAMKEAHELHAARLEKALLLREAQVEAVSLARLEASRERRMAAAAQRALEMQRRGPAAARPFSPVLNSKTTRKAAFGNYVSQQHQQAQLSGTRKFLEAHQTMQKMPGGLTALQEAMQKNAGGRVPQAGITRPSLREARQLTEHKAHLQFIKSMLAVDASIYQHSSTAVVGA